MDPTQKSGNNLLRPPYHNHFDLQSVCFWGRVFGGTAKGVTLLVPRKVLSRRALLLARAQAAKLAEDDMRGVALHPGNRVHQILGAKATATAQNARNAPLNMPALSGHRRSGS